MASALPHLHVSFLKDKFVSQLIPTLTKNGNLLTTKTIMFILSECIVTAQPPPPLFFKPQYCLSIHVYHKNWFSILI